MKSDIQSNIVVTLLSSELTQLIPQRRVSLTKLYEGSLWFECSLIPWFFFSLMNLSRKQIYYAGGRTGGSIWFFYYLLHILNIFCYCVQNSGEKYLCRGKIPTSLFTLKRKNSDFSFEIQCFPIGFFSIRMANFGYILIDF